MLLVVLGAGASADFAANGSDAPFWRPPLTDELVADDPRVIEMLNGVPLRAASGVIAEVRHLLKSRGGDDTLEDVLDELAARDGLESRTLIAFRLFVQAYLDRVSKRGMEEIGGVTNQTLLVRTIEHWRPDDEPVLYVTFNYDTILDQALAGEFGWDHRQGDQDTLAGYLSDPRFRLFKLHGSCNWGQRTTTVSPYTQYHVGSTPVNAPREALIRETAHLASLGVTAHFTFMDDPLQQAQDWWSTVTDETPAGGVPPNFFVVPALAIPLRTKATFTCPESHVSALRELLPQVDRIITIGWKAGEPDFVAMLGAVRKATRLVAVNRSQWSRQIVRRTLADGGVRLAFAAPDDGAERDHAFLNFVQSAALDSALHA